MSIQLTVKQNFEKLTNKLKLIGASFDTIDEHIIEDDVLFMGEPVTMVIVNYHDEKIPISFNYVETDSHNLKCQVHLDTLSASHTKSIINRLVWLIAIHDMLNFSNKTTVMNIVERKLKFLGWDYRLDIRKIVDGYKLTILDAAIGDNTLQLLSTTISSIGISNQTRYNRNGHAVISFEGQPF